MITDAKMRPLVLYLLLAVIIVMKGCCIVLEAIAYSSQSSAPHSYKLAAPCGHLHRIWQNGNPHGNAPCCCSGTWCTKESCAHFVWHSSFIHIKLQPWYRGCNKNWITEWQMVACWFFQVASTAVKKKRSIFPMDYNTHAEIEWPSLNDRPTVTWKMIHRKHS